MEMNVKKSVFGSKGEQRGFDSIEHTWGEEYRVFPQFPFSALFERDKSIRDTSNLFFKTSVDYLLCTKIGQPLLAIDFDGLGKGFDRDGQYIKVEDTPDPYRKQKFDFKLRYAKKSDFPYYVIASEEFEYVGEGIDLTIADGIIGSELASRDFRARMPSVVEEHRDVIERLRPDELHEYIQDLVIDEEIESDFKLNPIVMRTAETRAKIYTILESHSWTASYRFYEDPELPDVDGPGLFGSAESLEARRVAMSNVERWGCVYMLSDTPVGEVSEIIWIRNVGHSLTLAREIAELLAYNKLLRLLRKKASGLDSRA